MDIKHQLYRDKLRNIDASYTATTKPSPVAGLPLLQYNPCHIIPINC